MSRMLSARMAAGGGSGAEGEASAEDGGARKKTQQGAGTIAKPKPDAIAQA